jgi:molybdopterin-biosynthesis enzyme MoeA-like protein
MVDKAFLLTGADAYESALLDLMEHIVAEYPDLRLYSLPSLDESGDRKHLELGVEGAESRVDQAMDEIRRTVVDRGIGWSARD